MSKTLKLNISGEGAIYRNDKWGHPVYSMKLCAQTKEGGWEYDYIQVQLPVGHELPNNTEIKINAGFISFFKRRNGLTEKYLKIQSYDILNQVAGEIDIPIQQDETDLPF